LVLICHLPEDGKTRVPGTLLLVIGKPQRLPYNKESLIYSSTFVQSESNTQVIQWSRG
jgi:hypothetical protein